ncbi:hypothetical protein Cus16_1219 [Curtobacterium sp. ER1/6]|nr:hypothetical protein Cus16_1219 [Curtobacterium sp. ER1/6]
MVVVRVLHDVGHRLLDDAEGRAVGGAVQRRGVAVHLGPEVDPRRTCPFDEVGQAVETRHGVPLGLGTLGRRRRRRRGARIALAVHRAQDAEDRAELHQGVAAGVPDVGERLPGPVGQVGTEVERHSRLQVDEGHAVSDRVVELAGDPHPLVPCSSLLRRGSAPTTLGGSVESDPDELGDGQRHRHPGDREEDAVESAPGPPSQQVVGGREHRGGDRHDDDDRLPASPEPGVGRRHRQGRDEGAARADEHGVADGGDQGDEQHRAGPPPPPRQDDDPGDEQRDRDRTGLCRIGHRRAEPVRHPGRSAPGTRGRTRREPGGEERAADLHDGDRQHPPDPGEPADAARTVVGDREGVGRFGSHAPSLGSSRRGAVGRGQELWTTPRGVHGGGGAASVRPREEREVGLDGGRGTGLPAVRLTPSPIPVTHHDRRPPCTPHSRPSPPSARTGTAAGSPSPSSRCSSCSCSWQRSSRSASCAAAAGAPAPTPARCSPTASHAATSTRRSTARGCRSSAGSEVRPEPTLSRR